MKAFPRSDGRFDSSKKDEQGMDLRDYFAAFASEEDIKAHKYGPDCLQVVQDLRTGLKREVFKPIVYTREQSKFAYADAMLKVRDGNSQSNE